MLTLSKVPVLSIILPSLLISVFNLPHPFLLAEPKGNTQIGIVQKQDSSKRLALVVGIDDYDESPLRFPVRDAELVAEQLKSVGFEVMLIKNPTLGALEEARDTFISKINRSNEDVTALFFFAGHAVQFDGHNYLIPTQAKLLGGASRLGNAPGKAAFVDRAINAQLGILNYLSESKASKIVFVLDACRINPFQSDHRAGASPDGLASMNAKLGGPETFILFAAHPGNVAFDGELSASNSPFTRAFANAISQPGSSLETVYRQVYDRVKSITESRQLPYQEGVLFGFTFREAQASSDSALEKKSLIKTGLEKRDYDIAADGVSLLKKILKQKTFNEILKAAENGDAEAQYLAAVAYSAGEGISTSSERAAYWLRRSAVRGFSRAQFFYGSLLYWGDRGIKGNPVEGMEWWEIAAENGNTAALVKLGDAYRFGEHISKDLEKSEKYYQRALANGQREAATQLGFLYDQKATNAKKTGNQSAFEAAQTKKTVYYQQAADQGSPEGMRMLAYLYRYGDHFKADPQMAIQWYKKSVEAGSSTAAEELASLYTNENEMGKGKAQPEEAIKYFRIALNLGSKTAGFELADLIRTKSIAKASDEALRLYEQAFANGSLRAAAKLSDIYLKGDLASKDPKKSEQYALSALELSKTVQPDSEDAWPMHLRLVHYNLLKLYKEEGLKPARTDLVKQLIEQVGELEGGMKRFTIPVTCGSVNSRFDIYIWNWTLKESPTTAQFEWLRKARGCEVSKDIVESFEKLYKIARENNVSFTELVVYALGNTSDKKDQNSNPGKSSTKP
ncbi:MAG: DUF2610 domain-containing protein [Synechococcales bacterium]|nr:DUF2610 domain-containing protein [Synechococcales bacterium]